MKSGTSITRSSCGEVLKSEETEPDGRDVARERGRTKERGNADGDAERRNRKYWIHATPTHNASYAIFGRFPFHAVASRASIA